MMIFLRNINQQVNQEVTPKVLSQVSSLWIKY